MSSLNLNIFTTSGHHPCAYHYFYSIFVFLIPITGFIDPPCRSLPGLALAGDLQRRPADAADRVHVLHAGDAEVPAVAGEEARGRGSSALPART